MSDASELRPPYVLQYNQERRGSVPRRVREEEEFQARARDAGFLGVFIGRSLIKNSRVEAGGVDRVKVYVWPDPLIFETEQAIQLQVSPTGWASYRVFEFCDGTESDDERYDLEGLPERVRSVGEATELTEKQLTAFQNLVRDFLPPDALAYVEKAKIIPPSYMDTPVVPQPNSPGEA